ncbi:MAG: DegT/DnrJ/EryC1/StrS aminotransferase [Betaproteobacteria bacterium]|nr:DegT/DnrJ/EryC1/StrS aminotransferase [Betaproteobacteria bacterium]
MASSGHGNLKRTLDDLAVFGGTAAFSEKLYVGRPNIGNRERLLSRIEDMLDRRWLSNDGVYLQEFERTVARMLGVRHCIATCNGTIALEIAIRALGLSGEVIVPSFTFIATAHALQWQQITPVFCDVDPRTHTLDPDCVERLVTSRTTGIIGVHLWGEAHHVEALEALARRRGLKLMFDAAHAFACSYGGKMIGNFGDAEIFSFHATKFLNTFEGGAICTNDDALAEKSRLMRNFGFAGFDKVIYIGTNGKMTEVAAAMGLTGLEALDEFIDANLANYRSYTRELEGIPGATLRTYDDTRRQNYQYIIVEVDEAVAGIARDALVELLHAENIVARRYFYPGCHDMEPYRSLYPGAGAGLPNTARLARQVMALPTGTAVGEAEIRTICQVVRFACSHGREITRSMNSRAPEATGEA